MDIEINTAAIMSPGFGNIMLWGFPIAMFLVIPLGQLKVKVLPVIITFGDC